MCPEVSVVVPAYRRETRLAFTLDALARQTLDPTRFEVIVVRDAEYEPIARPPGNLNLRFVSQPGPGPSVRRNAGWRASSGRLIAFTDDDCRPSPSWLEAILDAFSVRGARADVILQGRTAPDPDEKHLCSGFARTIESYGPNRWFPTCNLALPRALLERLGGFDESLAFHCEDTDLGLRAEALGARLVYVDEAVVWHAVHSRSLRTALRDATQRHSEAELLARHPQHRDVLYMGAFVSEGHARITLAAVGLLMAPRHPRVAALAAYPYAMGKLNQRAMQPEFRSAVGLARFALAIIGGAVLDAAEVAMRVPPSLRTRTLAL